MTPIRQALIAGLGLLFMACGGGGSGRTGTPSATSVMIAGRVSGSAASPSFNGRAMAVAGGSLTAQGMPVPSARVQPGVVLQGTANRTMQGLQLVSAELAHELEGPITSVDLAGSSFVVLGRKVLVDGLTRIVAEGPGDTWTSLTLADLKAGDVVEVFGSEKADGSVLATRVEREAAGRPEVDGFHGTVSALDTTAKTFQAGGFLVSYGSATVQGTLANGVRVEVRGIASGSAFTATWVRVETGLGAPGTEVELSGPISGLDAVGKTFLLMSYKVDYSMAEVEGTLAEGADVEVEGAAGPAGSMTVLAREVSVRFSRTGSGDSDAEREGVITAVDLAGGTITIGGATYWTDASTLFIKMGAPGTLADMKVGMTVQLRILSTRTNAAGQAYAAVVRLGDD